MMQPRAGWSQLLKIYWVSKASVVKITLGHSCYVSPKPLFWLTNHRRWDSKTNRRRAKGQNHILSFFEVSVPIQESKCRDDIPLPDSNLLWERIPDTHTAKYCTARPLLEWITNPSNKLCVRTLWTWEVYITLLLRCFHREPELGPCGLLGPCGWLGPCGRLCRHLPSSTHLSSAGGFWCSHSRAFQWLLGPILVSEDSWGTRRMGTFGSPHFWRWVYLCHFYSFCEMLKICTTNSISKLCQKTASVMRLISCVWQHKIDLELPLYFHVAAHQKC